MVQKTVDICKKVIAFIIEKLYLILMFGMLIGTLLIDRFNPSNRFENEAKWANGGYYFIALLILGFFTWLFCKNKFQNISKRVYLIIIIVIAVGTAVIQYIVGNWAPLLIGKGDFASTATTAINLANGGDFVNDAYFMLHPNNVNLAIALSFVYRIFGDWRYVLLFTAVLTNVSVLLMTYVIRKTTGSRFIAIIMNFLGQCIISLAWRAFMPYSDLLAMPFIIGMFVILFSGLKNWFKAPLIVLLGMIGTWIKITAIIPLLGIVIYYIAAKAPIRSAKEFFGTMKKDGFKAVRLKCIAVLLVPLVIVGGLLTGSGLKKHYKYTPGEDARTWHYMFLVGQNNENTGQVVTGNSIEFNPILKKIWKEFPDDIPAQRKGYVREALNLIKNRGIFGNIKFYTKKLNVAFNDGSFHAVQPYKQDAVEHNIIYQFYNSEGKYYEFVAGIRQIMWDFILILLAFPLVLFLFRKKRDKLYLMFEVTFVGIILYLFLFEGRSKYLFMFLPVFFTFAALMMDKMMKMASRIRYREVEAETVSSPAAALEAETVSAEDTDEETDTLSTPDTDEETDTLSTPDTDEKAPEKTE